MMSKPQPLQRTLTVLLSVLIFMPTGRILAQFLDQGAITGTVEDQSDAIIPGAQVILVSPDTGFKLVTKADRSGVYVFSPI